MNEKETDSVVLWVKAGSDPRAVGSSIAHFLHEGKQVSLRSVGAGAGNQTSKAIAIATQWTAPRGYGILVRLGFADVPGRNEGSTITAMTWSLQKG